MRPWGAPEALGAHPALVQGDVEGTTGVVPCPRASTKHQLTQSFGEATQGDEAPFPTGRYLQGLSKPP